MGKTGKSRLVFAVIIFLCLCLLVLLIFSRITGKDSGTRGLFSWSSTALYGSNSDDLFSAMDKMKLNTLYQSFSSDVEPDVIEIFLKKAADHNISVWYLTGDPSWALDSKGKGMIKRIKRAADLQSIMDDGIVFAGVMMDCEPYMTDLWDEDREGVMDSWLEALCEAHKAANDEGLQFSVCIPYFLDTIGFSFHVERLIEKGCDQLAIMNYYKENEAQHIETEVRLASKAGISVTVIYELQPAGTHGLKDINTYNKDGLGAVIKSWASLSRFYKDENLSMALHEYKSLREVAKIE